MCLHKVLPLPEKLPTHGWKVYLYERVDGNEKRYAPVRLTDYNKTDWNIDNSDSEITNDYNQSYKSGFHVFSTRKAARSFREKGTLERISKVLMRGVTSVGIQSVGIQSVDFISASVIVCRQFKFVE